MIYRITPRGNLDDSGLGVSLVEALGQAVKECPGENEEEGGFILERNGEYKFLRVTNRYTGTPTAVALYEPDRQEYGSKIIASYDKGYRNFASFHTHPTGCAAWPSVTDLTRLFNGQPVNVICSPSRKQLNYFKFEEPLDGHTSWGFHTLHFPTIA